MGRPRKIQATQSARLPGLSLSARTKAVERLKAVAIRREGVVLENGSRSHYELRQHLNPRDASIDPGAHVDGDEDGFLTSTGRFVTRREAAAIGVASGQLGSQWSAPKRILLSSDIKW